MTTTSTPPPLQGPTANEKKYDRQLRLWGANGQQALEDSHILLINGGSGVAGIETLKNLVLPSIGAFTISDSEAVTEADLGVNFFLDEDSLDKPRAAESCKFLLELNPHVQGHSIQKDAATLLQTNDITQYDIIIVAAPQPIDTVLQPLANLTAKHSIPLLYLHCAGFISHFSLQLPDTFPIVETHPDPETTQDLRLLEPWDDLVSHMKAKTTGLENMSDHEHGHVPYLLLLLHYLEEWRAKQGKYPESYADKREFRKLVQAGARTSSPEGGEENYDEAVAAVLKSLNPPQVPSGLREIFEKPECKAPSTTSSSFFLIAHAISAFVSTTGALPLPGTLPDMKAQSADYIGLQNLYRAKSQADIAAITLTIRALEIKLQRPSQIPAKEVEAFCKNASFVKLIHGRPVAIVNPSGQVSWSGREKMVARELQDSSSKMAAFIALLASDSVYNDLGSSAKTFADLLEKCSPDSLEPALTEKARAIATDVLANDAEADVEEVFGRVDKICKELARYGPTELHNTAAHLGGMVAQEVIKLITKQYVSVDNTCVFDSYSKTPGASIFRL